MKGNSKLTSALLVTVLLLAPHSAVVAQIDTVSPDRPGVRSQPSPGDSPRDGVITQAQQTGPGSVSVAACQRQLDNINRLTSQVVIISERQIEIFDTIFERVDRLYIRLELEADGYNEQVVEVANKRNLAYRHLDSIQTMSEEFGCEIGDFRVRIAEFRNTRFELLSLLRDYRSSIIDLIVMIQAAAANQQDDQQGNGIEDQNQNQESDINSGQTQNNTNSSGALL